MELQRQIIEKSVAFSDVSAFIAKAGPGLMDPFNEQAMQWDAKTKRLSSPQRSKAGTKYYAHITLEHFK